MTAAWRPRVAVLIDLRLRERGKGDRCESGGGNHGAACHFYPWLAIGPLSCYRSVGTMTMADVHHCSSA